LTLAEDGRKHAQAQWPETTARVQSCSVDMYTRRSEAYWIDCRISYLVGGLGGDEEIVTGGSLAHHTRST